MDRIEIKGYKSFKDLALDLLPINILIGSNGSGKSNFLSFFEFLNRLYEQKLTEYVALNGGIDKYFFQGSKTEVLTNTSFRAARLRMLFAPRLALKTFSIRLN